MQAEPARIRVLVAARAGRVLGRFEEVCEESLGCVQKTAGDRHPTAKREIDPAGEGGNVEKIGREVDLVRQAREPAEK